MIDQSRADRKHERQPGRLEGLKKFCRCISEAFKGSGKACSQSVALSLLLLPVGSAAVV
jgi:hypothetical protein